MHESHGVAAKVTTSLTRTGVDTAAALLWQGYTQTMVNMHVFCGADMLEVPTQHRMVEIASARI
jgi:hypothetical protein